MRKILIYSLFCNFALANGLDVLQNDKKEIVGILDQISLSSFFATNTFSVSNQIVKAETVEETILELNKLLQLL